MRLTTVILIASLMQVSAATFGQRVTLKEKDTPLERVIEKLRKQTGYDFLIMDYKLITDAKKVNLDVKNVSLEEALESIFENQKLSYTIKDKSVAIKEKEPSFLDNLVARFSAIDVRGKIIGENDQVLAGATVKVKGTNKITKSNEKGEFYLAGVDEGAVLEISYIGFKALEIPLKDAVMPLEIKLNLATGELEEVKVVCNTGYQNIDKTRATGSFVKVDNALINRKVGTDILSRLEGVVPGLLFDRRPVVTGPNRAVSGEKKQSLQIRGMYTLSESVAQPLIVLDNFPFEGNLLDINPNDVENITVLKDAAAASIWGARAGNGVIVITTKKGSFNQKFQIGLTANYSTIQKPNLFQLNSLPVKDYVAVERFLFDKGKYDAAINDPLTGMLTPVRDVLLKLRNNEIDKAKADRQIDQISQYDLRSDFMRYIYRNEQNQQYQLNLSGGSNNIRYMVSTGFDRNLSNLKGNEGDRITFRSNTTITPVKKITVDLNLSYTGMTGESNSPGEYGTYNYANFGPIAPYLRLADDYGNPLAIDMAYRREFTDTAGKGKLLDWKYRPLDELANNDRSNTSRDLMGSIALKYDIIKGLNASFFYQYLRFEDDYRDHANTKTFSTRDLINMFSQINGPTVKYVVPNEGILDMTNTKRTSQNLRGTLNFNHTWNNKHEVAILLGADIGKVRGTISRDRVYGYNDRLSFSNVDYVNQYPLFFLNGAILDRVPSGINFSGNRTNSVGYYTNGSYTYNRKYTLSASARRDASNLFGVKTNDKGRPLWSVGGLWDISAEGFYKSSLVPSLRAKLTYGYSGNSNQNYKSTTVIAYLSPSPANTNLPSASITTPGVPGMRWEKVGTLNAGVDFVLKNNVLSGSVEYYRRRSIDVIASERVDPTKGRAAISSNSAHITGQGVDLTLNTALITRKDFSYNASFNFSYTKYEVTKYLGDANLYNTSDGSQIMPFANPYSIVSYKWAGLDPATGDPRGWLNGKISKNYDSLTNYTPKTDLINHGSALPKYFGNWLHTITYKNITLSTNINYSLGYFFRKPSINYSGLFDAGAGNLDFVNRWQKPGDENITNIPSMVYERFGASDNFYQDSEINVHKGDHIRLTDVQIGYSLPAKVIARLKIKRLSFHGYFTNLNILLYKANKVGLDPNILNGVKPGRNISFGVNASL